MSSLDCEVCGPLSLVKNAKLPRCQINRWMPEPFLSDKRYRCRRESVRRVRGYPCNSEKAIEMFLCREDAELVERYNEREGVKFDS